jgi:thymidine phosphorylase
VSLVPTEVIRAKRDGGVLSRAQIDAFVRGLVDGSWSDSQAAAMAMAILLRGMAPAETAQLADAMTHSGTVLDWRGAGFHGPVLDKHSTGGVGDKVSLMLAPMLAACGAVVPMVSGRGLGHTGGTLDKLEALPGYTVLQPHPGSNTRLLHALRTAGCAIVGASSDLAPADRRLYAIRDVTATVESVPLITASILSKKRAAGLQALVMDVKFGSGAFTADPAHALELAQSLVCVATAAGLPTVALLSDMHQVLGRTAGNALEVREAIDFLCGHGPREQRQLALTLALGAHVLQLAGVAGTLAEAEALLQRSLDSGAAAERFARMVAALGGPADVLRSAALPTAPVQRPVPALRSGHIAAMDTRAVGMAVLTLGGGRVRPGDAVDPRVGIAGVRPLGAQLQAGEPLAMVHAASSAAADAAIAALQAAITLADAAPLPTPVVHRVLTAADLA